MAETIETRPFPPFLPKKATVMMMGTFPPEQSKRANWIPLSKFPK